FVALLCVANLAAAQSPFSSVKMELTISRDGVDWKAEAKINVGGNELTTPARDLKLNGNDLSFFIELEGAQVKFAGKLSENKLTGTLEAIEKGARVATGTWTLQPADYVAANSLAGKWIGSFSAQVVPAQQVDPNFDTRVPRPA